MSGWQYQLSVTAFDKGSDEFGIEGLESSANVNAIRVFPGTPANEQFASDDPQYQVGVYPNPYRLNAAWDGLAEGDRKLYFYNLPAKIKCVYIRFPATLLQNLSMMPVSIMEILIGFRIIVTIRVLWQAANMLGTYNPQQIRS